jgi:hypothetical protein
MQWVLLVGQVVTIRLLSIVSALLRQSCGLGFINDGGAEPHLRAVRSDGLSASCLPRPKPLGPQD